MNYKKPFYQVPNIIYGNGSIKRLNELIPSKNKILIVIDSILNFDKENLLDKSYNYSVYEYDATKNEPYTKEIDDIAFNYKDEDIDLIIGIGGGSTMDVSKSLSVMIPVIGKKSSEDFQGWDLVNHNVIYKIGVPTLSGSGSEASRTAVLNNGFKKQGINSHASMFNSIILDPNLSLNISHDIEFYSAMDCYIHSVESLEGSFINDLSKEYAQRGLSICRSRYYDMNKDANMTLASYFGGVSIVNSEVGICHALSYGLSIQFNIRHGLANCLIFNHLGEYYGEHVNIFHEMLKKNNIVLPINICKNLNDKMIKELIDTTYLMENPLKNALGDKFKDILTPDKIIEIYSKI